MSQASESSVPAAIPSEDLSNRPVAVSARFLLQLYWIVAAVLAFIAIDFGFFGGRLRYQLPFQPAKLVFISFFFEMPHIVASSLLLLDRRYLSTYRTRLLAGGAVLGLAIALGPSLLGMNAFLVLAAGFTIYHVVGQQFGIARILIGPTGKLFTAWKWVGILAGAAIMVATFYVVSPHPGIQAHARNHLILETSSFFFVVLLVILSAAMLSAVKTARGRWFVAANLGLILACYLCYQLSYLFFVLLMPRMVHDLTAFSFYVVHDRNRVATAELSYPQQLFCKLGVPAILATPLLALLLAAPVTHYVIHQHWNYWIYWVLGGFHYYTESFTWKRGSPHSAFASVRSGA